MGVTISCRKTGRSIDLGGGGFFNLRNKVSDLVGDPWASHYRKLEDIFRKAFSMSDEERKRILPSRLIFQHNRRGGSSSCFSKNKCAGKAAWSR